jgi:hypothetical protein
VSYLFLIAPEVLRDINLRDSIDYRERTFNKRTPRASNSRPIKTCSSSLPSFRTCSPFSNWSARNTQESLNLDHTRRTFEPAN